MQIEEKLYPLDGLRHDPAGDEFRQTSLLEEPDAPTARSEAWSAFTPASDRLEDILLIPEEPLETVEAPVEAEVLEDVFGNNEAPSRMAGAIALPVEAGGVELQAIQGDGDALHTSLLLSEQAANEAALPSVESFRGQAHVYDKYAVGMRILRISPVWLLLSTFGFLSIIILFSWMSRPEGNASALSESDTVLRNEATNRSPAPATAPVVEVAPAAVEPVAEQPVPAPPAEAPAKEVTPAQASPAPLAQEVAPQTAAVETAGNFTVQVGSYPDASQANERVSALRASGVEAQAAGVEIPKRGTWYRVQAGRFQTREEATRFGAQLRAKGAADNVIVAEVEKR
ncbi:MAG: SPOR domain-containing protein [Acidobacteria bacterium]|nr:SPOR domain-containing protein [Acidobacteriota bacterium]